VHNTQSGLFSIWAKNTQPSMSLAAAGDTFAHGLLEAAALLHRNPGRKVLLVCGDEPIPASIAAKADRLDGLHAVAMLLDHASAHASGEGSPLEAAFDPAGPRNLETGAHSLPDPLLFLRWWLSEEREFSITHPPRHWVFSRRDGDVLLVELEHPLRPEPTTQERIHASGSLASSRSK
jgi:hypothetical protein